MTGSTPKIVGQLSIVVCGQAGQGIQTVEKLLTKILMSAGYHVFATKEYMSRVRGGMNSTEIRISEKPVRSLIGCIDILLPLDAGAITHLNKQISSQTLIVGDEKVCKAEIGTNHKFLDVPFTQIAIDAGNKLYSNVVAAGAILSLLFIREEVVEKYLRIFFDGKPQDVIEKNIEAFRRGFSLITSKYGNNIVKCKSATRDELSGQILASGADAVGFGALAGGCNFLASYPMSPSTGVLAFMAQCAKDFRIIVEQAEDEIAAVNMAVGAWYAGARAMVTTSGGGFALMTEGISLAGMLESPLVIHLAQRPGPATGLPTRTEQGDLELAVYAGHGEFPRIIFAPGTLEEAFDVTAKAFELADKLQVQVIILTDQLLMDSCYNTSAFKYPEIPPQKHFIKTSNNYRRYEFTAEGISPRGIPGFGDGLVCVDSDEHDEEGHITENMDLRIRMVNKRLKKYDSVNAEIIPPKLTGPDDYKNIIICWGSTFNAVNEALHLLGRNDTAVLHFSQVFPIHEIAASLIKKASKVIVVEGNSTGQFARLLKLYANIEVNCNIRKYDGIGFFADLLAEELAGYFGNAL